MAVGEVAPVLLDLREKPVDLAGAVEGGEARGREKGVREAAELAKCWYYNSGHDTPHGEIYALLDADAPEPAVTVERAARVLLGSVPNPIFDRLKYDLMGEFSQTQPFVNEDGNEDTMEVTVEWTVTKDIITAALRALIAKEDA